jgi:hypothetical protein
MADETSKTGRIARQHSHSFKISDCLRKDGPACSSVQYSERKWQSDWHSMMKRVIGFFSARACCSGRRSDDIHKFRFRTQNWRPAPWVTSHFSSLLSKSKGHFQRHRRPCWHLDQRSKTVPGCSALIHVAVSLHLGSTIPKQIDCVS